MKKKKMTHLFDIYEAKEYGIEEAIVLYNIRYWLTKNKANKKNDYDGYYWTFNSVSAFKELFPYMSYTKVKRVLKKLQGLGVLKSGNYNKVGYDRTKWYTIPNEFESNHWVKVNQPLGQSEPMEGIKMNQPIPDVNTDKKQQIKNTDNNINTEDEFFCFFISDKFRIEWIKLSEIAKEYKQQFAEDIQLRKLKAKTEDVDVAIALVKEQQTWVKKGNKISNAI